MVKFLDDYRDKKEDLNHAIDSFNQIYNKSRSYFFNFREHSFQMINTEDFFQLCLLNNIKLLSYSPVENKYILKSDEGIIFATNNRILTAEGIFAWNDYMVPQLYIFEEFVVFDIGMNRGYASLKFANFDSCKAVYGFEIDEDTYNLASQNFKFNPHLQHKIKSYNFGLSDLDDDVDLYYIPGSDGITTTELEFTNIAGEWIRRKEDMKIKKASVKSAGTILSQIIEEDNITSNIVLKIDTEGSEYKIIDDLINKGVLDKVDLILGETHLDSEDLSSMLIGFKKVSKNYDDDVSTFCFVKEEHYDELPLAKN